MSRIRLAAAGFAVAAAAAGIGIAGAALTNDYTDASGAYHGCVNTTNGLLRVVAPGEACRVGETEIQWSAAGGGLSRFQDLAGTPCTLAGKSGTTVLDQGNAWTTFQMNALCVVPDRYEPNETASAAAAALGMIVGTIYPAGDVDWYSFRATNLWFSLSATPVVSGFSAELYRDGELVASGPPLSYSFNDGTAHDWLVHVTAPSATTYAAQTMIW